MISPSLDAYTVFGRKRAERQGRLNRPASGRLPSCLEDSEEIASSSSSCDSNSSSSCTSVPNSRSGESPVAFGGLSPDDQVERNNLLLSEFLGYLVALKTFFTI